jgi:hypothetical protein
VYTPVLKDILARRLVTACNKGRNWTFANRCVEWHSRGVKIKSARSNKREKRERAEQYVRCCTFFLDVRRPDAAGFFQCECVAPCPWLGQIGLGDDGAGPAGPRRHLLFAICFF